jgi:hypothetical protein
LRIENLPETLEEGIYRVELCIQRPDGSVESEPCAISESYVTSERRKWGNSLILVDNREHIDPSDLTRPIEVDEVMLRGKYRLRMYPATKQDLQKPDLSICETTIEAPWAPGHSSCLTLNYNDF